MKRHPADVGEDYFYQPTTKTQVIKAQDKIKKQRGKNPDISEKTPRVNEAALVTMKKALTVQSLNLMF